MRGWGLLLGILFFSFFSLRYAAVPPTQPVGNTGAPGESSCGRSSCHGNRIAGNSPNIKLVFGDTVFRPGKHYRLTLSVDSVYAPKYGFQLTVRDTMNMTSGLLESVAGEQTHLTFSGNKQFLSHFNASSKNRWDFNWNSPDSFINHVKFYIAVNAANGNGKKTGDTIHHNSFRWKGEPKPLSIESTEKVNIDMIRSYGIIRFEVINPIRKGNFRVFNMNGNTVAGVNNQNQLHLYSNALAQGIYILQYSERDTKMVLKFIVP